MIAPILIAGVGNELLGDDGFGVEVTRRLAAEVWPEDVAVVDIGVRGLQLTYELLEERELLIVIDAISRDGRPGTLYLIDPEVDAAPSTPAAQSMDLGAVFQAVAPLGGTLPPTRIVGCEPMRLDARRGLSPPVLEAIDGAVAMVRQLVADARGKLLARDRGARLAAETR